MRLLALLSAVVAAFACMGVTLYRLADRWLSDPLTVANRQQQLDAARASDLWWASFRGAITGPMILFVFLLAIVVPVAVAVVAWGWTQRGARDHDELVRPDKRGLLPVSRAGLLAGQYDAHSAAALAGYHAAQIEAARNTSQPIPSSVTHYSFKEGNTAAPRPGAGQDAPQLAAPPVAVETAPPSFAELLTRGWVGPGYLMLGWDPARSLPAYGTFADLLSFAILGSTGSGKSTSARALLAQSALNGAKLCIIDPHMRAAAGQSVAGELAPFASCFEVDPIDDDPGDVSRVLQHMMDILERRKRGEQGPHIICVIDEWTSLVSRGGPRAAQLTQAARLLAIEGRKVGLHAALLLQDCTKESAGPVRDVLSSSIIHRTRPSMARLIAPGIAGQDTWTLAPGQMIMDTRGGIRRLTMPNCEPSDVQALARLLPAPSSAGPRSDSASWSQPPPSAAGVSCTTGDPGHRGEPVMGQPPTSPDAPARPPLRVIRPDDVEAETEAETPDAPVVIQPENAPPPTSIPTSVSVPATLTAKAKAARFDLSAEEWDALSRLDRGQTPNAIAAALSGASSGRKWTRKRDELQKLVDFVKGWPDGETWATESEAE